MGEVVLQEELVLGLSYLFLISFEALDELVCFTLINCLPEPVVEVASDQYEQNSNNDEYTDIDGDGHSHIHFYQMVTIQNIIKFLLYNKFNPIKQIYWLNIRITKISAYVLHHPYFLDDCLFSVIGKFICSLGFFVCSF